MNEFQAAMGICNLRHVDEWIEQRREVVERYRERLSNVPGLKLVKPQQGVKENYAYFPVVFDGYKVKGNPGTKEQFHNLQVVYTAEGETAEADTALEILRNEGVDAYIIGSIVKNAEEKVILE